MDKYVTGCTLFIALEMLLVTLSYVEPERDAEFKLIGDRCFVGLQAFFLCYAAYCRRFEMSKMTRDAGADAISAKYGTGSKLLLVAGDNRPERSAADRDHVRVISRKGGDWRGAGTAMAAIATVGSVI